MPFPSLKIVQPAQMLSIALLCLAVLYFGSWTYAQNAPLQKPLKSLGGPVQVQLREGDIQIDYIEAAEGMSLLLTCRGVTVQGRRLFLGDGKEAIRFEATEGFYTHRGLINAAGVDIDIAKKLKVAKSQVEKWGVRDGEIYVRVPELKFEIEESKP